MYPPPPQIQVGGLVDGQCGYPNPLRGDYTNPQAKTQIPPSRGNGREKLLGLSGEVTIFVVDGNKEPLALDETERRSQQSGWSRRLEDLQYGRR